MAFADHSPRVHSLGESLFAPIRKISDGLVWVAELNRRVHDMERMFTLSDAQLAQRGLRRDQIVRTVFADLVSD